jgi:hypothetical protein
MIVVSGIGLLGLCWKLEVESLGVSESKVSLTKMSDSLFFIGENKDPLKLVKTNTIQQHPHMSVLNFEQNHTFACIYSFQPKNKQINVTNYHTLKLSVKSGDWGGWGARTASFHIIGSQMCNWE